MGEKSQYSDQDGIRDEVLELYIVLSRAVDHDLHFPKKINVANLDLNMFPKISHFLQPIVSNVIHSPSNILLTPSTPKQQINTAKQTTSPSTEPVISRPSAPNDSPSALSSHCQPMFPYSQSSPWRWKRLLWRL
ncbi:hypothetical protein BDR22DRAFT_492759 [Usnea florida]